MTGPFHTPYATDLQAAVVGWAMVAMVGSAILGLAGMLVASQLRAGEASVLARIGLPLVRVARGEMPLRLLGYAVFNKLARLAGSANRKYEFERRYLENPDPWDYQSSEYEKTKYRRTLETASSLRTGSAACLELGCAIGVFTKDLIGHFDHITANDISEEALRLARARVGGEVEFVAGNLVDLALPRQFNVIFCAEVLSYLPAKSAPAVRKRLDSLLAPGGVILIVTQQEKPAEDAYHFDRWDEALAPTFAVQRRDRYPDPKRPYEIVTLGRA